MTSDPHSIKPLSITELLFALSSLIFTVVLAIAIVTGSLVAHHHHVRALFSEAITQSDFPTAFSYFLRLEHTVERLEGLYRFVNSDSSLEKRSLVRRTIFEKIISINSTDRSTSAQTMEMLRALPTIDLTPEEVRLLTELRIKREELGEIEKALFDTQEEVAARHSAINKFLKQHALIGDDFGELLGLSSAYERSGTEELRAYSAGVLQYLPILSGIPDNVSDLTSLRSVLAQAGGRVQIQGENVAETFAVRLESLKTSSRSIVSDIARSQTRIQEIEDGVKGQKANRDGAQSSVKKIAAELLYSLTSTNYF